jgi:hypothetical protein
VSQSFAQWCDDELVTTVDRFASYVKGSLQYLAAVADKQQNGQEDLKDGGSYEVDRNEYE